GGLRMVGFLADVTARATAERAVQEREELLRSVLAHIPDGVFWKDRDSVYLGCNDRVARDSGLAFPAEVVGTTDLDTVVAPAEAAHYRACDRRVMEAGEPLIGIEETRTMPDGRVLDLLTSKVPLRDATGAVVGVLGVYRDVTDRNRAEEALRRSQALFRTFMDNTPAVAFIKDSDGRYVYANRRWEEQFAPPRRDWAGRTDADFWAPEAAAAFRDSDRAALEPGWLGSVVEVVPAGVGAKHFLALKFPVEDEGGRRAVGGVVLDVTEQARLEEQLRQAQKMEAVGRLAGGVAHDFNNLLTVINGFGDMALDALPLGDPARHMVEEMRSAGTRAADLTRQLLAYGRKQLLRHEILDLGGLAAENGRMLRLLVGADVELVLDPRPAWVAADPGQLVQVLMNLSVNARDAMPLGGRLAVRTRAVSLAAGAAQDGVAVGAGAYALLEVADTGTGMSADVRGHLFEPFFTTKGQGKGTGLGLATVYGIVKQSGGHVEVETGSGRGTTFRVYLPAAPGPPTTDRPTPAPAVWSEAARATPGGRETVLLVEDDDGVRVLTMRTLQRAGYTVVDASTGERALQTVAAYDLPVDLLVTDVVMPGMGGRALADRLTALRPGARVLFMSGYMDDAVLRHGVEQDRVNFIPKPFSPADLTRKVKEVLDGGG
ncbi:MAG TPA: PAS domain-containing protein, partial [Urbifossiella sp.]|nr:PAS domain-containing protein [Urbifossiella sp.]